MKKFKLSNRFGLIAFVLSINCIFGKQEDVHHLTFVIISVGLYCIISILEEKT